MTRASLILTMAHRIAEQFNPNYIILFGSQARGDTNESSDVDLMVVLNRIPNKHRITVEILDSLRDIRISKDIIVVTPEEIEREGEVMGTITYEALQEGKIIYEKN